MTLSEGMILAEGGSSEIVIPEWPEVIVGTVAFALLCFVLIKFVFPKMEETFKARVDAIEGGIERANKALEEANALLAQYKQQLAEARTAAAQIREEARADAHGIKADILTKAEEDRDRILAAGRDQLAANRQQLIRELRGEIGELSVELAGRIIGESLADEARQSGTVERFLTELDAEPAGRA